VFFEKRKVLNTKQDKNIAVVVVAFEKTDANIEKYVLDFWVVCPKYNR
jgi:hypothetical protein